MTAPQTPSQTAGPFFSIQLTRDAGGPVLAGPDVPGERVVLHGRLLDGEGTPIEDGLLEVWQANSAGRYRHPVDPRTDLPLHDGFTGFGRTETDFDTGAWSFTTVRPGRVPAPDGTLQAPHVNLVIQARGMLNPSWTRIYLADEPAANEVDPVLQQVPAERRATLVAQPSDDVDGLPAFQLDLWMQGPDETVFLDW